MKKIETRDELINFLKSEKVELSQYSKAIYMVNYYDNKNNAPVTPLPYSFKDPINAIRMIAGQNGILEKSHLPVDDIDIVIEAIIDSRDYDSKKIGVILSPYIYFNKEEQKKEENN